MSHDMTINEIRQYIPHRYPFILVDRVLSFDAQAQSMTAIKNVTINEPFFTGHFPAKPVMPGVLMIEALAQTSGLLMARILDWPKDHDNLSYLAGIDNARFKRIVEPGDQLELCVEVLKQRRSIWKFSASAFVQGEVACSAEILVATE